MKPEIMLLYFAALSFIAPLTAGAINFKRLNREMRLLSLLMAVVAIVSITTLYLSEIKMEYHWVHHIYTPVEYILLATIFSFWVRHKVIRKILIISIPGIVAFSICNSLYLQSLTELNSNAIILTQVFYSLITSYTLYVLMTEDYGSIYRNHVFWIASGLLIFSAGDLAYFAFYPMVRGNFLIVIWAIHAIFNIIVNVFYLVGILCQARQWK